MFLLFFFIVFFFSYVTAVCFLSRFPTLFRQISMTLTLFFPNSFAFLSFFLCLLSRSLSFLRHCCVFVCHCRPPTVFRQFSPTLLALSVVPCLSYFSSLISLPLPVVLSLTYVIVAYLCLVVLLSLSYVTAVLLSFVCPLYFVNSLRLCLLSSVVPFFLM